MSFDIRSITMSSHSPVRVVSYMGSGNQFSIRGDVTVGNIMTRLDVDVLSGAALVFVPIGHIIVSVFNNRRFDPVTGINGCPGFRLGPGAYQVQYTGNSLEMDSQIRIDVARIIQTTNGQFPETIQL